MLVYWTTLLPTDERPHVPHTSAHTRQSRIELEPGKLIARFLHLLACLQGT